jgi:hypothetical protein
MKITPDESFIDFYKVDEFVRNIYCLSGYSSKMRAFAIENLDWNIKMKLLKSFLENVDKKFEDTVGRYSE